MKLIRSKDTGTSPVTGGATGQSTAQCLLAAVCRLALRVLLPLSGEAQSTGPGVQAGAQKREDRRTCVTTASLKREGVPEVGTRGSGLGPECTGGLVSHRPRWWRSRHVAPGPGLSTSPHPSLVDVHGGRQCLPRGLGFLAQI